MHGALRYKFNFLQRSIFIGVVAFVALGATLLSATQGPALQSALQPSITGSGIRYALGSGSLRIGTDQPPQGIGPMDYETRRTGTLIAEFGAALESALNTKITFVRTEPAQAATELAEGRIDAMLSFVPASTQALAQHEVPLGPPSALAPIMRSDTTIRSWRDMAGKTACISEDQAISHRIAESEGARVTPTKSPSKALALMRMGECDLALLDAEIVSRLVAPDAIRWFRWQKFSATLPKRLVGRWTLATAANDEQGKQILRRAVGKLNHVYWTNLLSLWAGDIDFETELDQGGADCH